MTITVYQRNDLVTAVTLVDEDGVALDLTGATLTFEAGPITKTPEITDAAAGEVEIALTDEDTDIDKGAYHYELLVTDVDGNRYTALVGTLGVRESLIE